jgi:acyl-CoA hydrolase/GNAT superfamily N-acetyltransferase
MKPPTRKHVDPAWREKYADLIATPAEAAGRIRPGQRVFVGTGCAQPQELVRALVARAPDLADVEIVHLLTTGDAPYAHRRLARHFRVNSFFISENVRDVIQEGLGDYTPVFLSDIPRLFSSGALPLDAALIQVTPPDERGMCSLGVSVDIVKSAAENASLVIAQVNRRMPRTLGDSFLPVTDIDLLVPVSSPILESKPAPLTETQERIGEYVAALVDDGSTIELGIGRIPHAVLKYLTGKKDLGIHTEMLTDAILDLIDAGAVTGRRKTLDRGKIVASFCLGTRRLYHAIHDNPLFAFHPTQYVNDPHVIARQHRMVAINVALEVDLTGQVCADSLGSRFFSGIGGQVDFNRGAARSAGGRAIIALPSTAKDGKVSRIVGRLTPAAGVTTTRGDVHYVVSEYGIAYLHGKSVQERAMALISIAHPEYRAQLLREAIELKYIRPELQAVEGKIVVQPPDLRATFVLDDGTPVGVRPIHPTDEPRIRDLFYALSEQTVYYRYMQHLRQLPERTIQNFVFIDHRTEVALVATVPEAHGEDIIAVGRYYLDLKTNRAEVAFVVRDAWQKRGIGSFLLRHLIAIARRAGIRGFTAEVLGSNRPMQKVFRKSPTQVVSELRGDVFHFELEFV